MKMLSSISVQSVAHRRGLALEARRNRRRATLTTTAPPICCGPPGVVPSASLGRASALYERGRRSRRTPIGHSNYRSCSRSVAGAAASSSSSDSISSSSATSPLPSTATSSTSTSTPSPPAPPLRTVVLGVSLVVITGVVNRLLYKASADACGPRLALFLALLQASCPAMVYSLILKVRVRAGMTSQEELDAPPTWPLLAVGAGEASSSVLGFLVASRLPGAALPMLAQSMLVWQMGFERFFLKRRQTKGKLVGAAMVVAGVCLAAWPAGFSNGSIGGVGAAKAAGATTATSAASTAAAIPLGAALTYAFAQSFPAAAALAKERIFARAAEKLNAGEEESGSGDGAAATTATAAATPLAPPLPLPPQKKKKKRKQLDTFVVSARASVAQAAVVAALLPLSALLGPARLSLKELPGYLLDGARAVAGLSSSDGLTQPIPGFPWLPLAYVTANVLFNVALLRLLRAAGAFVYSAGAALLVPAAIVAFSVPWRPSSFLPQGLSSPSPSATSLGPHFVLGAVVLVAGLAVVVATSSSAAAARGGRGRERGGKEKAAAAVAVSASFAQSSKSGGGSNSSSDDDEQKFLVSPPLLGDVGLEAA